MEIVALMEAWHIGDGNYPLFDQGQAVKLAFELDNAEIQTVQESTVWFRSHADASCEFTATIIGKYGRLGKYGGLTVLDSGELRFYVNGDQADGFKQGTQVRGRGLLELDHFAWMEGVGSFINPPNLFYELTIKKIRKVRIPDRFIYRHAHGKSHPTVVSPGEYSNDDVTELATMNGQQFDEEFYLLNLASA